MRLLAKNFGIAFMIWSGGRFVLRNFSRRPVAQEKIYADIIFQRPGRDLDVTKAAEDQADAAAEYWSNG